MNEANLEYCPILGPENKNLISGGATVKSFPYTFTDEEKANIAESAAHLFQKIQTAEMEKKAIIKQHDEKIQIIKNQHALANSKVISGVEQRDFKCKIIFDFSTGKKYFYDEFSLRKLGEAPLDADDYQLKADLDSAGEQIPDWAKDEVLLTEEKGQIEQGPLQPKEPEPPLLLEETNGDSIGKSLDEKLDEKPKSKRTKKTVVKSAIFENGPTKEDPNLENKTIEEPIVIEDLEPEPFNEGPHDDYSDQEGQEENIIIPEITISDDDDEDNEDIVI